MLYQESFPVFLDSHPSSFFVTLLSPLVCEINVQCIGRYCIGCCRLTLPFYCTVDSALTLFLGHSSPSSRSWLSFHDSFGAPNPFFFLKSAVLVLFELSRYARFSRSSVTLFSFLPSPLNLVPILEGTCSPLRVDPIAEIFLRPKTDRFASPCQECCLPRDFGLSTPLETSV